MTTCEEKVMNRIVSGNVLKTSLARRGWNEYVVSAFVYEKALDSVPVYCSGYNRKSKTDGSCLNMLMHF